MNEKRVVILDLELGNLHSVARAVERAGGKPEITADPDRVRQADRVIVPGQGAIRKCMSSLEGGLGDSLLELVRAGRPYLGICLGMQALFESSEEAPDVRGLGYFGGRVVRFENGVLGPDGQPLKVPHMGWNQIDSRSPAFEDGAWFYFVHSYYCAPEDPSIVVATANYGGPFCVAIERENVLGCQFHPEKSHRAGVRLLSRFLETH
ncbi:MAG: imidazole glycerol phosphate synthase subunit HisH [Polyangiaceae bacterium]|nr:imidazole glycerol phosphate synthase subunit HisH [Polyangiaceae bacterium]